jgi:hypothetical protein
MSTKAQLIGGLSSLLALALASAACAVGSDVDTDIAEGTLASTPVEVGAEEAGVKLPPPSTTERDAGAPLDASADAAKADAGDAGTTTNNTNTTACTATAPCASAADLGAVSGDTGADVLSAQGTTSAWFRVMVDENDNGLAGVKLLASATLDSPAGANFDLYLYVGSAGAQECSAVSAQSTQTSGSDSAGVSFGESGVLANGSKDSRYVTVEVRHVSGTCASNAKWTLTFKGNT